MGLECWKAHESSSNVSTVLCNVDGLPNCSSSTVSAQTGLSGDQDIFYLRFNKIFISDVADGISYGLTYVCCPGVEHSVCVRDKLKLSVQIWKMSTGHAHVHVPRPCDEDCIHCGSHIKCTHGGSQIHL